MEESRRRARSVAAQKRLFLTTTMLYARNGKRGDCSSREK
jgi:hypothetical protein